MKKNIALSPFCQGKIKDMKTSHRLSSAEKFLSAILVCGLLISFAFGQERFRRNPPYPEPLSPLLLPPVESAVLSSGMRVVSITRLNNPIFNLQVLIQAGEIDSPPELSGLATVTSQMLLRGTLSLSPSDVEERLETLGIEYYLEVKPDYTLFSFTFLEENLEQALNLIRLFFYEPSFSALELTSTKRELYYRLTNRLRDQENAGSDFFLMKLLSGDGFNPGVIDPDLIKKITTKDLVSFHQRLLRPNNTTVIFNGNLNLNNASRKASQAFSRWVPKPVERKPVPRLTNRNFDRLYFLENPGKEISIVVGNLVSPLHSEDYFPLLVLNHILGGTTGSRLFLNLRESKGIAYYAFSELSFIKDYGFFWIRVKTSPELAAGVIREINQELKNLVDNRVEPLELERAKAYLMGNLPLQLQNPDELSKRFGLLSFFQLPQDFWLKYNQNVMQVSAERVQEIARKYLTSKPLTVIVGEAATALDYLRDFDKIEIYNRKGQFQAIFEKGVLKYENSGMRP